MVSFLIGFLVAAQIVVNDGKGYEVPNDIEYEASADLRKDMVMMAKEILANTATGPNPVAILKLGYEFLTVTQADIPQVSEEILNLWDQNQLGEEAILDAEPEPEETAKDKAKARAKTRAKGNGKARPRARTGSSAKAKAAAKSTVRKVAEETVLEYVETHTGMHPKQLTSNYIKDSGGESKAAYVNRAIQKHAQKKNGLKITTFAGMMTVIHIQIVVRQMEALRSAGGHLQDIDTDVKVFQKRFVEGEAWRELLTNEKTLQWAQEDLVRLSRRIEEVFKTNTLFQYYAVASGGVAGVQMFRAANVIWKSRCWLAPLTATCVFDMGILLTNGGIMASSGLLWVGAAKHVEALTSIHSKLTEMARELGLLVQVEGRDITIECPGELPFHAEVLWGAFREPMANLLNSAQTPQTDSESDQTGSEVKL